MKVFPSLAVLALSPLALAQSGESAKPAQLGLAVPVGPAIDLDGRIGAEEWQGALRQPLGVGGELFLRSDEHHLYLGLRGTEDGWSHVYLEDGEELVVRHASAALGSARYARDDLGLWQPLQAFPERGEWALRDPGLTPERRAERQAFLAREGWVASNNTMGKRECELVLARKGLGRRPRLAVVFVSDPAKPLAWPATLADACVQPALLAGTTPADLVFRPESWRRLELAPPAPPK